MMPLDERQELIRHIVGLLMQLSWMNRKQFAGHLAEHGLTPPQFYTLAYLAAQQGEDVDAGCAIHRIADAVHQERPTMTGIIDRLERAGLVERHRSLQDRRKWLVKPTEAGRRLLREAGQAWHSFLDSSFDPLETDELAQLEALLRQVVDQITPGDGFRLPLHVFGESGALGEHHSAGKEQNGEVETV